MAVSEEDEEVEKDQRPKVFHEAVYTWDALVALFMCLGCDETKDSL